MGRKSCFHIPEDLLLDLLPRLPTKTLARFKCVSKGWKHIISNQIHVMMNPKLLVFSHDWAKESSKFNSVDHEALIQTVRSPVEENLLREKSLIDFGYIVIHSSLNGLLLIQIYENLFMWNPLTSFFRKVNTYPDLANREYDQHFIIELCFDFVSNMYKVVLVESFVDYSYSRETIYVGTCGSSSWVKISVPRHIENFVGGPFFKGHRHWICRGYTHWGYKSLPSVYIVYFDPDKNEFIEVPTPQPKEGDEDCLTGLGVLDGCLCVTRFDDPGCYEGNIEILMMKEYGNPDSWNIMFTISNLPEFQCYNHLEPLFRTKTGEILVSVLRHRQSIMAYDANGNFVRDVFVSPDHGYLNVTFYEESWCSPTCYGWEIFHPKNNDSLSMSSVISGKGKEELNIDLLDLGNSTDDLPWLQGLIKEDHHSKTRKKEKVFSCKREGLKKKFHHRDLNKKKRKAKNYETKESLLVWSTSDHSCFSTFHEEGDFI